jgi:hypothetical protein
MAIPQRTANEGAFFITTICYHCRRTSQVDRNATLFLETLTDYRPNPSPARLRPHARPPHPHLARPLH